MKTLDQMTQDEIAELWYRVPPGSHWIHTRDDTADARFTEPGRYARVSSFNADNGEFDMVLATEGEASDGDILEMKGGQVPDSMPLLASHYNDPTAIMGTVTQPRFHRKSGSMPAHLTARGSLILDGDGPQAEIRRDMAMLMDQDALNSVSIRWDSIDSVRRVNLPSNSPFFVDAETEKNWRKRYGVLHTKWRALEGSLVAIGADPLAIIRCADSASSDDSREFMRGLAVQAERSLDPARETRPSDGQYRARVGDLWLTFESKEEAEKFIEQRETLESRVSDLEERLRSVRNVEPDPADEGVTAPTPKKKRSAPRRTFAEELRAFKKALDEQDERVMAGVREMLRKAKGKV